MTIPKRELTDEEQLYKAWRLYEKVSIFLIQKHKIKDTKEGNLIADMLQVAFNNSRAIWTKMRDGEFEPTTDEDIFLVNIPIKFAITAYSDKELSSYNMGAVARYENLIFKNEKQIKG